MTEIIYDSDEDRIAIQYFSRLTNTVGAVGLGVALGLLTLPKFYACVAFAVFLLWSFLQGHQYRKMLRTTYPASQPSIWIFIKYGWLCLLSLILMASIGLGWVSKVAFFGIVL